MTERPSDEQLVAFLDGALDEDSFAAVEAWVGHDPAVRARLQVLAETTALVRESFDEVLREPIPERLLRAAMQEPRSAQILIFRRPVPRRWVATAAAACLAVVVVGSAAFLSRGDAPAASTVLDNIAGYHNLLTASATAGESPLFDVPAGSEQKLPVDIHIPNMKPWGLEFQGARKIIEDGKPGYQFYYSTSNKDLGTITVTLWKSSKRDSQPTFDRRYNVNLMYWRHAGLGCAIAGQANKGYMWNMAQDIAWQLQNG